MQKVFWLSLAIGVSTILFYGYTQNRPEVDCDGYSNCAYPIEYPKFVRNLIEEDTNYRATQKLVEMTGKKFSDRFANQEQEIGGNE